MAQTMDEWIRSERVDGSDDLAVESLAQLRQNFGALLHPPTIKSCLGRKTERNW